MKNRSPVTLSVGQEDRTDDKELSMESDQSCGRWLDREMPATLQHKHSDQHAQNLPASSFFILSSSQILKYTLA